MKHRNLKLKKDTLKEPIKESLKEPLQEPLKDPLTREGPEGEGLTNKRSSCCSRAWGSKDSESQGFKTARCSIAALMFRIGFL